MNERDVQKGTGEEEFYTEDAECTEFAGEERGSFRWLKPGIYIERVRFVRRTGDWYDVGRKFWKRGGWVMSIAVGQTAPDFTLPNQDKKDVKLSEFAGKKNIVLVFYPLDWSPVCTNEHACFVNDMKAFETLDAEVLGVSVDSVWSHKAYAEKMGIKYSLLADFHPKGAMSDKYGVYLGDKGITGRSIVIINKAGKVAWVKNYDIPVVPDLKEVAAALSQVKAAAA